MTLQKTVICMDDFSIQGVYNGQKVNLIIAMKLITYIRFIAS